jgi:hypothetical protein
MTLRICLLLAACWLAAPALAQTPTPDEASAAETEAPEPAADESGDEDEETEELPDIDIWAEDAAEEEDVFIPTERISADANIAYPADI